MILRDWRDADSALLRSCYERERQSWQEELGWDTTWTWATVERARASWSLPGLVAFDEAGAIQGWAFSMKDGSTLHIGGLVAASPPVTSALLERLLDSPVPAGGAACFIRHRAPGLLEALASRGFEIERFLYLSRPLAPADTRPVAGFHSPATSWNDRDFTGAARLMQACYSAGAGRHFAPSGTIGEWAKYLSGVVQQAGCGLIDRDATRVQRVAGTLQALALVTSIHPETAHLAQLVVHPDWRGCGVATRLIREALACAARAGRRAMTLLVGERNESARRLYASLGFSERATFVAARTLEQPAVPLVERRRGELLTGPVC
jgi:ribosomal protein S18 acetylase RimI-like enzyme